MAKQEYIQTRTNQLSEMATDSILPRPQPGISYPDNGEGRKERVFEGPADQINGGNGISPAPDKSRKRITQITDKGRVIHEHIDIYNADGTKRGSRGTDDYHYDSKGRLDGHVYEAGDLPSGHAGNPKRIVKQHVYAPDGKYVTKQNRREADGSEHESTIIPHDGLTGL